MNEVLFALIGAAIVIAVQWLRESLWGFAAQKPTDYIEAGPALDLRKAFKGPVPVSGLIHDFTGRAKARFTAVMDGSFTETGGVIDEVFTYANGDIATRQWRLTFTEDGHFTAEADDIIGVARGRQLGNAVQLRYRLKLPEAAGGHVLNVTDWMYLSRDGVILNRSEMRKFGLRVAELTAVMRPPLVEPAS